MGADNANRSESKKNNLTVIEISTIKRREIQAPVFADLMRGFISEVGYDKAMEVASAMIQKDAIESGKIMAGKYGGNTIKELARVLREGWAEENALEFTILEETEQRLYFDVTRCRYAELYDRLGVKDFGCCLSCDRDAPFIQSFNPRMKLLRSQMIMEGGPLCDFRIIME